MPTDLEPEASPSRTAWLYDCVVDLVTTATTNLTAPIWYSQPHATTTMSEANATETPRLLSGPEPNATATCHLLNLPAELREIIYNFALAPGILTLTSSKTKRYVVQPSPCAPLLRACKQIYREAHTLLYTENEVLFTVDAHDTCWPTINETRTPEHVLERLEHICIILDCTGNLSASYEDVDFTAFEALISLKTLRIGLVYDSSMPMVQIASLERADDLFEQILMRIPKTTQVLTHIECGSPQQELLEELISKRRQTRRHPESLRVLPGDEIGAIVATVSDEIRGSMSGGNDDVFADYHDKPGTQWKPSAVLSSR